MTAPTMNPFVEHPAEFNPSNGGEQWTFKFGNGYGASVIRNRYSYGGDSGRWELAVLDASGELDYSTPVTSDVEGYLDEDAVRELLRQVAELPAATS